MKIGVLGTRIVGKTITSKLVQLRHEVKVGPCLVNDPKITEWASAQASKESKEPFADAATFGEIIFKPT